MIDITDDAQREKWLQGMSAAIGPGDDSKLIEYLDANPVGGLHDADQRLLAVTLGHTVTLHCENGESHTFLLR